MVASGLQEFLRTVHETSRAVGVEELCRLPGMPDVRSVYRWHDALGDDLIYFPNIALQALGLVHVHLFIDDPGPSWESFAYVVRGLWVVRSPGERTLYVHCVIPAHDVDRVCAQIATAPDHHECTDVTIITTGDGWQTFAQPSPVPRSSAATKDARDLLEHYPLIIAVIFEALETRKSYPALWEAICQRLGDQVWEYLPRFSRRLPHNGKQHVRDAFRLLTNAHLVQQHVIRYTPLSATSIELFLLVNAQCEDILASLPTAVEIEVFTGHETSLVRIHAPLACLTTIFSATLALPITACWFVDRITNERQPLRSRFSYETLFDPQTGTWVRG